MGKMEMKHRTGAEQPAISLFSVPHAKVAVKPPATEHPPVKIVRLDENVYLVVLAKQLREPQDEIRAIIQAAKRKLEQEPYWDPWEDFRRELAKEGIPTQEVDLIKAE